MSDEYDAVSIFFFRVFSCVCRAQKCPAAYAQLSFLTVEELWTKKTLRDSWLALFTHCSWRLSQLTDSSFSWAADCGGRWASVCAVFCVRYLCGQETIAPVSSRVVLSQFSLQSSLQPHTGSGVCFSRRCILPTFLLWGKGLWDIDYVLHIFLFFLSSPLSQSFCFPTCV